MLEVMFNLEYFNNKYKNNNLNENSNKSTEIGDINNNNEKRDTSSNSNNKIGDTNSYNKIGDKNNNNNNKKKGAKEKIYSYDNQELINNNQSTLMNSSSNNENKNNGQINEQYIQTKHYLTLYSRSDKIIDQNSIKNKSSINYNITYKIIGVYTSKDKNNLEKYYTAEFIKEIHNMFISFGTNNELFIYNDSYEKISTNQTEDWIYNILYYKGKNKNETSGFIAPSKNKIYMFSEERNKSIYKTSESLNEKKLLYLFFMENNYYFLCGEKAIYLYNSLFDKLQSQNKYSIYDNVLMKSGIKIDNIFVAFKSNKIASKGKSQLLIYNYRNRKDILKE
jgi:hypothetical protein